MVTAFLYQIINLFSTVLSIIFFLLCWYFACKPKTVHAAQQNGVCSAVRLNGSVSNGCASNGGLFLAAENGGLDNPVGVNEIICDEVQTEFWKI